MFELPHSFIAENKLKSHEKVHKYKDYSGIVMPSQKIIYYINILYYKLLQFNQCTRSDKMPDIYADLESLIRKIDECANNPKKFSTTKLTKHIPCRYTMSTIWAFDNIEK